MSWQEKIEQYKTRQQQEQKEAARLNREEKLRLAKEKIPPLLKILEQFNCRELLLQMRDEVWKLGDVSTTPDLDDITSETPIEAKISLLAQWPFYEEGYEHYDREGNLASRVEPEIAIHSERLSIGARYDSEGNILLMINPERYKELYQAKKEGAVIDIKDKNATIQLETLLIEDCISRQERIPEWGPCPPFDGHKRKAEPLVIKAICDERLKPPKEFEYLLELAEKARPGKDF